MNSALDIAVSNVTLQDAESGNARDLATQELLDSQEQVIRSFETICYLLQNFELLNPTELAREVLISRCRSVVKTQYLRARRVYPSLQPLSDIYDSVLVDR